MEITEVLKESEQYSKVLDLLQLFDVQNVGRIGFTDSSHGEDDIRHNYIMGE